MTTHDDRSPNDGLGLSPAELDSAVSARLSRRPWPATPIRRDVSVSFEFFPTNTDVGAVNLEDCTRRLDTLAPDFFSVTYGAGGSTRERTHDTIERVRAATSSDVAGHLTCVAATREQVQHVLDTYRDNGVRRIVALRGDTPPDVTVAPEASYADAASLVEAIRARADGSIFDISVAAYPEVHPKAESRQADLDNLKRKLDAGADRAITQFFFDTDTFLRFLDDARAAGIQAPIVPGIMPITNFERITGFAARCGTSIPDWMPDLFGGVEDTPEAHNVIAATVAAEQCRRLAEHGVNQFHFYTMNKPELTMAVCHTLGLRPAAGAVESVTSAAVS